MVSQNVIDRTIEMMEDRLSLAALNQKLIASNLANINTPNYSAKRVNFEKVLRESLEEGSFNMVRTHPQHFRVSDVEEALKEPEVEESGPVDLDVEMVRLAQNSVEYQFLVTMLNKKFSLLKEAMGGGR